MTTAWTPIDTLTAFAVGKPITFEHGRLWYNNPIAIAEGADGAPRISRRAIQPGGSGIEGLFNDGSVAPSQAGFYEYEGINLAVPKAFPFISHIRVNGDVALADSLSITPATVAQLSLAQWFNAHVGNGGQASGSSSEVGTGGGGSIGNGGQGDGTNVQEGGGAGKAISGLKRVWLNRLPILGGRGGITAGGGGNFYGRGGGCLILIVAGDLDMTGGTLDASGGLGLGDGSHASGGGGGGSLIVICTGTITNGTFRAKGGDGRNNVGINGGGGGGGYIALVASDFVGVQTLDVTGGDGPDSAASGTPGFSETETLTEAEINGLLLR